MEQIINVVVELAVWGSIALLIWGGALCLHTVFTGGRKRAVKRERSATRKDHSAIATAID
jgi:hypothetical protein